MTTLTTAANVLNILFGILIAYFDILFYFGPKETVDVYRSFPMGSDVRHNIIGKYRNQYQLLDVII